VADALGLRAATPIKFQYDYIKDVRDEAKWKELFCRTENKLVAAARQARQWGGQTGY